MLTTTACTKCGQRLKLKDEQLGRNVKCPLCSTTFLAKSDVVTRQETKTQPAPRPNPAPRFEKPPTPKPAAPIAEKKPRPAPVKPPPEEEEIEEAEEIIDEEPPPEEPESEEPRPKKKKRRKKRRREDDGSGQLWLWVGASGTIIGLMLLTVVVLIKQGYGPLMLGFGIYFGVMMPISIGILVLSMFISSSLGGGIDFGEVHTALAKSFLLLLIVNVIGFIPYGCWFNGLVWLFGLMALFRLDLWEARMVSFINWFLNFGASMVLFHILLHAAASGRFDRDFEPHIGGDADPEFVGWSIDDIKKRGGKVVVSRDDPDVLDEINMSGTKITDADLPKLTDFEDVLRLDLSNTGITDAGLRHLRDFTGLRQLKLTGTKVTPAGVQQLQKELRGTKIIYDPPAAPAKTPVKTSRKAPTRFEGLSRAA